MSYDAMKYWHFAGETLRDGTPLPKAGDVLMYNGPIQICESGFHMSERAIDALGYAPGNRVALVEPIDIDTICKDKIVARGRKNITDYIDVSKHLMLFARQCARDVLHVWDAPEVVMRYLETGDERIRLEARIAAVAAAAAAGRVGAGVVDWGEYRAAAETEDAARAAAEAANEAENADEGAAGDAAWDAAWLAARAATRFAAEDADWYNRSSATRDAAWDAQNKRLEAILMEAFRGAAK